jgi:hypothetical protein
VIKNNDHCLIFLENIESSTYNSSKNSRGIDEFESNRFNSEASLDNINDFQVNDFYFLSNDVKKMQELILMNLNVMLKKDYVLLGAINISNRNSREYKMLFKKVKIYLHTEDFSRNTY